MSRAFVVSGLVQGVGYRWFAQASAARLGVQGWVANRRDGDVEDEVHGEEGAVGQFLAALASGPAGARVEKVQASPTDAAEPAGFEIRR